MRLIEYTPDRFEALCKAAEKIQGNYSLRHRPFVDYYYASREGSKLYLFLSLLEDVIGVVGVERMPFEFESRPLTLGIGTNFHALQRGIGGLLFMQWVKSCALALEYGGTEDAHVIIRKQNWTYFPGVRIYTLNHDYPVYPSDPAYRRAAKWMARRAARKKISAFNSRFPAVVRGRVSVREESAFTEDLFPSRSPFRFRLAPTVEYLSWRYNLELSFVTYRLFRILVQGRNAGYVIINENDQRLLVAQCDGDDAQTLAYAVLLSVLETGRQDSFPRTVLLTCSHPAMAEIYMKFGFKRGKSDYPMAVGGLRKKKADISTDTTNWLVNFDWGDNGLLGPFVKGVKSGREQDSWV
ncbi:MAG: hypothetical protein ACRD2O_02260 [Terriglobia bacterium]